MDKRRIQILRKNPYWPSRLGDEVRESMSLNHTPHYVLWNIILSLGQLEKLTDGLGGLYNGESNPKENKSWRKASSISSPINSRDWTGVKWDCWWLTKRPCNLRLYKSKKNAVLSSFSDKIRRYLFFFLKGLLCKVNFCWTNFEVWRKRERALAGSVYEKG